MTTPLLQIEQATKNYANARDMLTERVTILKLEIEKLQRKHLRGIRTAVRSTGDAHGQLNALIQQHQQLFTKPRTKVMSGVKVGMSKGKGTLLITDEEKTCNLIEKKLPLEFDVLVKQKQTVIKTALNNLSGSQLRMIGVTVKQTGDQVVIKPTDSTIDKYVTALLKEAEKIDSETEAA